MKYYYVKQHDKMDCGAACLAMILGNAGCKLPLGQLRHEIKTDLNGSTIYGIVTIAEKYGAQVKALSSSFEEFIEFVKNGKMKFPLIVNVLSSGLTSHFIIIDKFKKNKFIAADPATSRKKILISDLKKMWLGNIICFESLEKVQQINLVQHSMDKYIKICKKQKKYFVLIILISLAIALIGLIGSVSFEYVVDFIYSDKFNDNSVTSYENNNSIDGTIIMVVTHLFKTLPQLCVAIIGFYAFRELIGYLRSYCLIKLSKKINIPVMMSFYEYVINAPMPFFSGRKTGDVMVRFQDAAGVCQNISDIILTIMIDGILVFVYGFFLMAISWQLFLLIIVTCFVCFIIIILYRNAIKNNKLDLLEKNSAITSYMKESIDGINTIKLFKIEKNVVSRFCNKFIGFVNKSNSNNLLLSRQSMLISFVSSSSVILVLWLGTKLCLTNRLEVGSLITFYVMMNSFISPLTQLIGLQPRIQAAQISADRLNDVFEIGESQNVDEETRHREDIIKKLEIKGLTFSYGFYNPILNNVNLQLNRGERIAIYGKNGCGKTTFANILMGLYSTESCDYFINGNHLSINEYNEYTNKFVYIPQESFFFSDSIYENLTYGLKKDEVSINDVNEIICKCKLESFISSLPYGIYTYLEENGTNLSAGTKQKLAIARALLRNPEILITDECTCNIDIESEKDILEMFDNLGEDITIINISHRIKDLENYDKVYILENSTLHKCH